MHIVSSYLHIKMLGQMSRFNQSRHGFSVMFPFSILNPEAIKPILIPPDNNFEIMNGLMGLGESISLKLIYNLEEDEKIRAV
jgi:hypothetical protein